MTIKTILIYLEEANHKELIALKDSIGLGWRDLVVGTLSLVKAEFDDSTPQEKEELIKSIKEFAQ